MLLSFLQYVIVAIDKMKWELRKLKKETRDQKGQWSNGQQKRNPNFSDQASGKVTAVYSDTEIQNSDSEKQLSLASTSLTKALQLFR